MKLNQRGSAQVIALAVAAVIIAGVISYYLANRNKEDTAANADPAKQTTGQAANGQDPANSAAGGNPALNFKDPKSLPNDQALGNLKDPLAKSNNDQDEEINSPCPVRPASYKLVLDCPRVPPSLKNL